MAEFGLPFQGDIWYVVQASDTGGVTDGDTALPISCKVLDVRYGIGDKHKVLRGFDAPNACHLLEQVSDLTLHIEYIPQCDDTMIADVINRTSEMKLQALGFIIESNRFLNTATDKSSFLLSGCKPKTIGISASINNEYIITIDFSVLDQNSLQSDSSGFSAPSKPAALTGAYLAFNVAGSITKDGGALARICDSIDITISHNLVDKYDHDSVAKQFIVEGAFDIEGSCDISLDEGGKSHIDEILGQSEFDLVINLGGAGCPKITIPNCKFKSGELDISLDGDVLADSAPFTGKPTDGDIQAIVGST